MPKASPTKPGSQGWPGLGLGLGPGLQLAAWLTCSAGREEILRWRFFAHFKKVDWKCLNMTSC